MSAKRLEKRREPFPHGRGRKAADKHEPQHQAGQEQTTQTGRRIEQPESPHYSSQSSGCLVQTASAAMPSRRKNFRISGICTSGSKPCNSGETKQSFNPTFCSFVASTPLRGKRVKQSTHVR